MSKSFYVLLIAIFTGLAAQAAPAPVPTPAAPPGAKAVAPKASGDKAASDNKCKYIFGTLIMTIF